MNAAGEHTKQSSTARCYYTPDAYRLKVDHRGVKQDTLWRDSIRTGLAERNEGGQGAVGASRDVAATPYRHPADPFVLGLIALNRPHTVRYLLFEQLTPLADSASAERIDDADGKAVRATLRFTADDTNRTKYTVVVWFDPAVNYLVRRVTYTAATADGSYTRDERIERFAPHGPGVYFPAQMSARYGRGEALTDSATARFDDVVVNKPLPSDAFVLRFPAGVRMTDSARGVSYRVNEQGNAVSAAVPLARTPTPPPSLADAESGAESTTEARRWTGLVVPASLALLGLGVVVFVFQSFRKTR